MTPAVVLCCAVADEADLSSVVKHLEAHGIHPEVLAGIDEQPRSLGAVLDSIPEAGVVAIFMGGHLADEHIMRIEGIFGARRGPFHELYVLREPPDVEELLARIGLPGLLSRGAVGQATRRRGLRSSDRLAPGQLGAGGRARGRAARPGGQP